MGDHRDGGSPPDDGGEPYARDLPQLPPEWGDIVIPDDLSALDAEVRELRRELRRTAVRVGDREPVALRVPIAIMAVAVVMALVSLVVMTWGRAPVRSTPVVTLSGTASSEASNLSDVILWDASGTPAALKPLLPAVILLLERCACPDLVRDVARIAPAHLTVVAVGLPSGTDAGLPGAGSPDVDGFPSNVAVLADPAARLASAFPAPAGPTATAIIVDATGRPVRIVRDVRFAADIGSLTVP
jgi:hypothetical protein